MSVWPSGRECSQLKEIASVQLTAPSSRSSTLSGARLEKQLPWVCVPVVGEHELLDSTVHALPPPVITRDPARGR